MGYDKHDLNSALIEALLDDEAISSAEDLLSIGVRVDLQEIIKQIRARLIRSALGFTNGNVKAAAALLCMNRSTLHETMRREKI